MGGDDMQEGSHMMLEDESDSQLLEELERDIQVGLNNTQPAAAKNSSTQ